MAYSTRPLFGGAITADLKQDLIDASDLRQVPDTQEVFLYPASSVSIIVEILKRVEQDSPSEAIKFHFDSLAHDNSAKDQSIEETSIPPDLTAATKSHSTTPPPILLGGYQSISKYNRTAVDKIRILMALYRIETKDVDLVVTINIPVVSEDGGAVDEAGQQVVKADFLKLVETLRIQDFGLFA